jgi:hypothetical protein
MRRNRAVWLLAFVAVILVLAGAVATVRRGFSARDQPSALQVTLPAPRGSLRFRRRPGGRKILSRRHRR